MKIRACIALLVAAAAVMTVAAPALTKDSNAPAGATDRWLPCEPWVMYHWLPFDERSLYHVTGINRSEFRRWIRDDDNHTLGMLVKRKGKDPDAVVSRLMKQWEGRVNQRQLAELTRRSNELMTQGHLAQHLFFHYFHNPEIALHSRSIFRIAPGDYHRARLRGFTPREIAAEGGVPTRTAVRRMMRVMQQSQRMAVRSDQTSRRQANTILRLQRQWVSSWLRQEINAHVNVEFPRGNAGPKGSRTVRACVFFAGSNRPKGPHELRESAVTAEAGRTGFCDLHGS